MGKMDLNEIRNKEVACETIMKVGGNAHYGKVRLVEDGYFLIPGDFNLEIDELVNEKEVESGSKFEFLIKTPDGKNGELGERGEDVTATGKVTITIHKLTSNVYVKSIGGTGGSGGRGITGADGGAGGDAVDESASGGRGGNGGSGGKGADGGNGGSAPVVIINYNGDQNIRIIVLDKDDRECNKLLSYGGSGGDGGEGGDGGSGGLGGKNGNGESRASEGNIGEQGKSGNKGKASNNKKMTINKI